jgi:hypothetical protein
MNIFCLSTGRCGSTTFAKSFSYAENYTSGHESRSSVVGQARFLYPDQHIESDNRLSWMLGSLERNYGDDPIYVHLTRNKDEVIESFTKRYSKRFPAGIMYAFGHGILQNSGNIKKTDLPKIAEMYVDVITDNISNFLKNKSRVIQMDLSDPKIPLAQIWKMGAIQGDFQKALSEWDITHNKS